MTKLIASTRILCMDAPKHPRHEVRLFDDGHVDCDCPNGMEDGRRIGTAVALGTANVLRRSCAGLVAFLNIGLPMLVEARVDVTGKWGGWNDAWANYATNGLVREVYRTLTHKRDAEHGEALKIAHAAIGRCARYRNGMSRRDFRDELRFVPNGTVTVGTTVALYSSDSWTVPLQSGWLESIGKAKPVIDGRFIVGMSPHPGFVFAIDGSDEKGFEIREFAVVGDKLGKVAR